MPCHESSASRSVLRHRAAPSLRRLAGVVTALGLTACAGTAFASGFSTARFGGEHGYPVTFNPTAIYYNPAGIAESEGFHIFADGNIAFRTATYDHSYRVDVDEPIPPGADGANTGKATLFNIAAAPMLGATGKFGDFALGLAWYVPFGGSAEWDQDEDWAGSTFPGPVDGEQRWYSINGTLRSMYWTLAAAYKIPKTGLSVGLSGSLIRSEVKTIRARNANGSDDIASEGRSYIDVGDWAWGFGLGAIYEAIPRKLWAGVSYTSRPNVAGGMALDGDLVNYFGAKSTTPIDFHQDLPDIVRLGARWKVRDNVELRLHGDWTRWSSLEDQCLVDDGSDECTVNEDGTAASNPPPIQNLPRHWDDAFGIRAGGSFWATEKIEVFGGLGYDSNAIPDEALDPSLTDFHDISVALGGRITVVKQFAVAASWTQFFYFSRDTTNASLNDEDAPGGWQSPSNGPDAGGKYTQRVGVLNINAEVMF
jgi:long-chain fatty acid transport protein